MNSKRCIFVFGVVIGVLLWGGIAPAGTIVEFDTTQTTIIDSLVDSGMIARPQICPADSDWIAYEIHHDQAVQLYLYHLSAGAGFSIISESTDDSLSAVDSTASRINYDLSWCPVAVEGRLWAAYVSSCAGNQDIYLYDVSSDKSYCLFCNSDDSTDNPLQIWGPPTWSPNGKCLTFSADVDGDANIFIIRGMGRAFEDPAKDFHNLDFRPLIDGENNQFGAAWCPVASSGYIAYTEQSKGSGILRIKVFDLLTSKIFDLAEIDSVYDYFAPTWNAGGDRLAYYRIAHVGGEFSRFSGPENGTFEVGVAVIRHAADSLILSPQHGASADGQGIVRVIPNFDRLMGPAWLPGGRYVAVAVYDEPKPTRLAVISLPELEAGQTDPRYWLRGFGGDHYDFPRDLNIVDRNISFTFGESPRDYLLAGKIVPSIPLVLIPQYVEVPADRRLWWSGYAEGEKPGSGFFAKIGKFLWSPMFGPDIGINKGIVPVAGGAVLLALAISGGGQDNGQNGSTSRDWTPPGFPDPGKARVKIGFKIGF